MATQRPTHWPEQVKNRDSMTQPDGKWRPGDPSDSDTSDPTRNELESGHRSGHNFLSRVGPPDRVKIPLTRGTLPQPPPGFLPPNGEPHEEPSQASSPVSQQQHTQIVVIVQNLRWYNNLHACTTGSTT
jgi:hypothetical protein